MKQFKTWALLLAALPASIFAQTVNVDLGKEKQVIRGFGGINFPGWIDDLSESQRATAFGNGNNQLGLSVLRIHVDPNESAWSREVATAQYAVKQGAYVFASPWSPPESMRETFTRNGRGGQVRLRADKYADYAQHLNKFVSYMKNNGVNLYGISVQNEPDYASEWTWWTPTEMATFLKNNAKSINCRIIAPESFQYTKSTSDPIINDSQAWAEVDILGTHLYGTQVSAFQYPLFESKRGNRELWMTEVYYPNSDANSGNKWPEALEVADHISNAMVVGNFQAYVWWYIRRTYSFIDDNGSITKRGSCMAQFSKFIRPGFVRVDATQHPGSDNNLNVSAYKKDNDVVIVAVNRNTSSKTLTISIPNCEVTEWERYVTDQTRNVKKESSISGSTNFKVTLDAKSAVTLVGKGKQGMPKVVITSPTSADDLEIGSEINFTATATDEDGTIKSVKFYNGTTLLGERTSEPYSFTVADLTEGSHTLKAVATDNEGNESSASITIKVNEKRAPFGGTPQTIPGRIEAENYDLGGNGRAYYDTDEGNKGEVYRNDDVDLDVAESGYATGWNVKGEWWEYTVNVELTDIYEWVARVSCSNDESAFHLYIDGKEITGSIKVPNYKDWTAYNTLKGKTTTKIEKGTHILRIEVDGSYFNLDWIEFNAETTGNKSIVIETEKHQGEYTVFTLDGKNLGTISIKNSSETKTEMKKLGISNGTYVLSSQSDTFKVEINE